MRNLQELPKFRDGLSYAYVEHARVEQEDKAVAWYGPEGMIAVPAAALGVLLLGPGTTITHAAVRALADNGCSVSWVGEDMVRYYASGTGETRGSDRLLKQVSAWADPRRHLAVVRHLYLLRFPEGLPPDLSLEQVRGREGVRVRDTYARASRETGVPWNGRNYSRGNWASADPVNRALSAGAACLYGVAHAGIVSAGYSPALGFIHTGKLLSFVYDVADVYKTVTLIPAAFEAAAEDPQTVEASVRRRLRDHLRESRMLERVVADLHLLFGASDESEDPLDRDGARPGRLWDPSGSVEGGVAYGRDRDAEGPAEPEG